MQIRYGGCKGVLCVCPELNGCSQQLVLRYSMRKFSSDHDILESCRISAPRKNNFSQFLIKIDLIFLRSTLFKSSNNCITFSSSCS